MPRPPSRAHKALRRPRPIVGVLGLILLLMCADSVQAQRVDHVGTGFFIAFLPNETEGKATTELLLTSEVETSVTITYPAIDPVFSTTVSLMPDSITVVDLGADPAFRWTPGTVDSNVVHAVGDAPFSVYASNRQDASTDVAVALPVDALGSEYLVQSYFQYYMFSAFAVAAVHDGTEVTITPAQDLQGGHPAGTPLRLTLNRGEAFLGLSLGDSLAAEGDLTGTLVEASRPVQLSNGHVCAPVRDGWGSCDHLFEIALPVSGWTPDAIAAPPPYEPEGTWYRVLASVDGTTVHQNGTEIGTINRGEFIELTAQQGPQVFSGDHPILVTQFLRTIANSNGDPSMLTVLSPESYLTRYTLATVGDRQFRDDYVIMIAHNADVSAGAALLDGLPVAAAEFTEIPGTDYAYAILAVADGTHTTQTERPHSAMIYGIDPFDTYIYHGGGSFLNPMGTAAVAELPLEGVQIGGSYPNPFRESTRIPLELDRAAVVRITAYDVLGREVARLVDREMAPGRHEVKWNGTNEAGLSMPPGLYLYRVMLDGKPHHAGSMVRVR